MIHHGVTTLAPAEVIARAKAFFTDRVPHQAAFVEKEGPNFMTLRGQGGEEIAIAMTAADGATKVRASTLLFDQAVMRFLSALPEPAAVA